MASEFGVSEIGVGDGAGDPASPVLLHVPHAGTAVPAWVRARLLLGEPELAAELAALTDHRTDAIAVAAAGRAAVRPWVLVNPVSRFVVDVERFPDEREEMAAVGMAAVYTARHPRSATAGRRSHPRRTRCWPRSTGRGRRRCRSWSSSGCGPPAGPCCSTCTPTRVGPLPYELHADGPRPAVCLGVDPVHTPPWLVEAARRAFAPLGPSGWTPRSAAPMCRWRTTGATAGSARS